MAGHGLLYFDDLRLVQEGERAQVAADVAVIGVHPELEERVRAGADRVEPDVARLALAELGAVGLGDQRPGQPVGLGGASATDQVDAGGDVAPLVAAADLQPAPSGSRKIGVEEVEEVVGLQQHVGELGEGDALVGLGEADLHRFLGQHGVDREVLPHVTKEVEERQGRQPVGVVEQHGTRRAGGEIEEALELGADASGVDGDLLRRQHRALGPLAAGVADARGPRAQQHDRPVPVRLEPAQDQHPDQAADVQAVGGDVDAVVDGEALAGQLGRQLVIGDLVDQAPPAQLVEDVPGHDRTVPEASLSEVCFPLRGPLGPWKSPPPRVRRTATAPRPPPTGPPAH